MRKRFVIILIMVLGLISVSCADNEEEQGDGALEERQQTETAEADPETEQDTETAADSNEEEIGAIRMTLKINNEEVNVRWEDNESVKALADLAAEEPITIDASRYGGFEQVGGLGTAVPSDDVHITTEPGDIVLYTGSNIVVFFGSNSWAYTRLGHIEGKSKEELRDMLGGNNVSLTITSE